MDAGYPPELAAVARCFADALPPGEPRVAFHAVTRLHVPADRLAAFDAAIAALGENAPLYWLSFHTPRQPCGVSYPRSSGNARMVVTD